VVPEAPKAVKKSLVNKLKQLYYFPISFIHISSKNILQSSQQQNTTHRG